ncbi:MAG TPA: hypothetical protein IGS52_25715 [Oscillatoriaceae cyanobacterium M33_DOE_052]|uniref:Uncharacterized protein n=1 Tax=Planktothricoides sp. SpSt-374 TaxID=2282167 RepID=A0A7C3VVE9_9CYAN|nr:hypothetical protein [Oscillatoriaceae cyanobacterium M33_DOE_052]
MSKLNDSDFESITASPHTVRLFDITLNQPFTASLVAYTGADSISINLFDKHGEVLQEVRLELDNGKLISKDRFYKHL